MSKITDWINNRKSAPLTSLLVTVGVLLFVAACTRSALPANQGFFIAPTLVGNATPLILETFTPQPATATPPCENDLVFMQDITVPDGQHFLAGQTVVKTWQVRNDGSCAWGRGYSLRLVDGIAMSAIDRQALPEAVPGDVVEITVQFTAPQQPGTYRSAWKAHDQTDQPFGVQIYVEIIVE
jgi:hypothetical protein